ncbi:hypothetical protein [Spirosoma arcticum]
MKRVEKLKVLQDVLQGQTSQLRLLHRQQGMKSLPYLSVAGIVDIRQCPPALYELPVLYSYYPTLSGYEEYYEPLQECLRRFDEVDPKLRFLFGSAFGLIWPTDRQYDDVPLQYIQVGCRDYQERYVPGGTVRDLRRYFNQSTDCFDERPHLSIFIETKSEQFDWYVKRPLLE